MKDTITPGLGAPLGAGFGRRGFLALAAGLLAGSLPGVAAPEPGLALDQVLGLVGRASPLGKRIMAGCLEGPRVVQGPEGYVSFSPYDASVFVEGRPESDLVRVVNTMVHEACHFLARVEAYRLDPRAFREPGSLALFPDARRSLFVPGMPCFPTREAAHTFPAFLKKTQRFEHYADSADPHMATQKFGVLGLLDEFSAYHVGSRAAADTVRFLARRPEGSAATWISHLTGADATMGAFQEFRGYILAWMVYARERRPEAFRRLVGCSDFLAGWRAVDGAFGGLTRSWYRDLPAILSGLATASISIQTRGDLLLAGGHGRLLFRKYFLDLQACIASSPALREMERLLA